MGSYKLGYTGDKVQQILEKADNLPVNDPAAGFTKGMILMWSGSITAVPDGWALCNGQNGTPNLMDKFIVGAGSSYTIGSTGGSASVALTTAQMPSHSHTITCGPSGNYSKILLCDGVGDGISGSSGQRDTYTVSSAGSNEAHENRPPYYALAYIMKL